MAYTLRDMLNTQAFQELQVIAGKDGLDNPVRYVGVLEAPDSIDFVKEHEFILTTGYVFSLQTDRMMTMIRQLHEHNAAGDRHQDVPVYPVAAGGSAADGG